MLFKKDILRKIKKGEVNAAFRKWKRPTVKSKGQLITPVGQLQIDSVEKVEIVSIQLEDVIRAGYKDKLTCIRELEKIQAGDIYFIQFHLKGPDPRISMREKVIEDSEIDSVLKKLDKMDRNSKYGPWTRKVLKIIDQYPGKRAQDIADEMKVDKLWLKQNIRKLKSLGFTISLEVGYRLSRRGKSLLMVMK